MKTIDIEKLNQKEHHDAFWILVWSVVGTLGAGILFLILHLHLLAR
jgi:hypothetical protein